MVDGHVVVESTLHMFRPSWSGVSHPEAVLGERTVSTDGSLTAFEMLDSTIGPQSIRDAHVLIGDDRFALRFTPSFFLFRFCVER